MQEKSVINTGNDSIVITKFLEGVPGGKALDITGFAPEVIEAGHVIIKDANDVYKPMPVSDNSYAELPANHTVVGVVKASLLTKNKMVAIMVRGSVNEAASPYPLAEAVKTALPLIRFTKD